MYHQFERRDKSAGLVQSPVLMWLAAVAVVALSACLSMGFLYVSSNNYAGGEVRAPPDAAPPHPLRCAVLCCKTAALDGLCRSRMAVCPLHM